MGLENSVSRPLTTVESLETIDSYVDTFGGKNIIVILAFNRLTITSAGAVGWCEGAVYLTSPGRPTDIGLQLGKACYPCSG